MLAKTGNSSLHLVVMVVPFAFIHQVPSSVFIHVLGLNATIFIFSAGIFAHLLEAGISTAVLFVMVEN